MSRADEASGRIPLVLLRLMMDQSWEQAAAMVADEFEGYLPQTSKQLAGLEAFIDVLRLELAEAEVQIHNNHQFNYDVWDKEYKVAVQALVTPCDGRPKRYLIGFFTVDREDMISGASLYYAECAGSGVADSSGVTR